MAAAAGQPSPLAFGSLRPRCLDTVDGVCARAPPPGYYEVQVTSTGEERAENACFQSKTRRLPSKHAAVPGPGTYEVCGKATARGHGVRAASAWAALPSQRQSATATQQTGTHAAAESTSGAVALEICSQRGVKGTPRVPVESPRNRCVRSARRYGLQQHQKRQRGDTDLERFESLCVGSRRAPHGRQLFCWPTRPDVPMSAFHSSSGRGEIVHLEEWPGPGSYGGSDDGGAEMSWGSARGSTPFGTAVSARPPPCTGETGLSVGPGRYSPTAVVGGNIGRAPSRSDRPGFGNGAGRWSRPSSASGGQGPADYDIEVGTIAARVANHVSISRQRTPGTPDPVGLGGRSARLAWLPEPHDDSARDAITGSGGVAALVSRRRPPGDALIADAIVHAESSTPTRPQARRSSPAPQRPRHCTGSFSLTARFESRGCETPGPGHYDPRVVADGTESPAYSFGTDQGRLRDSLIPAAPLVRSDSDLQVESRHP
eukprot:TRINITY_DN34495_c0_g1_i1.p1 TRINITY_DN34495_c0_g1~~TRINITY_DN34495_c0_g1_i1.p1  ORF type:complete len:499 (-),score=47.09 TRINITY_DN34495_c0_g1_i1:118-1578(-)